MFLTRRNVLAYVLILLAAVGWTFGCELLAGGTAEAVSTTQPSSIYGTRVSFTNAATFSDEAGTEETEAGSQSASEASHPANSRSKRIFGAALCTLSVILGVTAVFGFRQKTPGIGPDIAALALGFAAFLDSAFSPGVPVGWAAAAISVLVLVSAREIWGWIRSRFSLDWCAVRRVAGYCRTPQAALLLYAGWIAGLAAAVCVLLILRDARSGAFLCACAAAGLLAGGCLWRYGEDLHHLERQLSAFEAGTQIEVRSGSFSQAEAQLLQVQQQHREAVRKAVASERFKVELIANVSHDLRTPLTAILGYSELLQKETLSADGSRQLARLYQKAGYMNELVESLFELTKVSSGVLECKREEIDLVRLLEQTIGLFDDQLTSAGLCVRRDYESETIPVVTDGGRMHQVFANLLGNAIKYALHGTRIYLQVRETETAFRVRMVNTASYEMGFRAEEIVQRFARGDKARSTGGSGLGLAIAQTYTESVGGTFRVSVDGDQFSAIVELPKTERNL